MIYKKKLINIKNFIFDVDGVFTDGSIIVDSEGNEMRVFNTKDGIAVKFATDIGYNICVISGGNNEGVRKRLELLGVDKVYLGIHEKDIAFDDFLKTYDIDPEEVLCMGDDVPDLSVLEKVGVATCPQDAVSDVKKIVDYVSHKKGGDGCVREIIEQVMRVQNKWDFNK